MKNYIFVQARMGSTRLPGKVLKRICGKSVLELIIERLKKVESISRILLVSGDQKKNHDLVIEAKRLKLEIFCGSEENVLDRFYQASQKYKVENIIRVTADCPLIDFNLINKGLKIWQKTDYDILSNNRKRTYPHGLDFEIFKTKALRISWEDNKKKFKNYADFDNTFHPPTKYILEEEKFKKFDLINDKDLSKIRLTLDYVEDLEIITKIYEALYKKNQYFGLEEILDFLRKNPSIQKINEKYSNI